MQTTPSPFAVPPRFSGAPRELLSTRRAGVPVTVDMPTTQFDLLYKGAHPLLDVLALLAVVSIVPAAWFGLILLAG